MPITIPPFVQYQAPLFPLRGLWNHAPDEGDKFVNVEIDWGTMAGPGNCVQIALAGNSPVAISQIVALAVDNGRCGSDALFLFPDSGFQLCVPANSQGVFPVFTNALMFYVTGPQSSLGDITLFGVLNSMPPVVAMAEPLDSQISSNIGVLLSANATTQLIPASVSVGTIQDMDLVFSLNSTAAGGSGCTIIIRDGSAAPKTLWANVFQFNGPINQALDVSLMNVKIRFQKGVQAVISASTFTAGVVYPNIYYTSP